VSDGRITPPTTGLAAMRIGLEFGNSDEFTSSFTRALARGGELGATLVAGLARGDMTIHPPRLDGPSWNSVPLFHLHRREQPSPVSLSVTGAVLEKLERSR
jgi:hypothetical protein